MSEITMSDLEFLTSLCNKMEDIGEGIIEDNGGLHIDFVCLDRFQELKGVEGVLRAWIKQEESLTQRQADKAE